MSLSLMTLRAVEFRVTLEVFLRLVELRLVLEAHRLGGGDGRFLLRDLRLVVVRLDADEQVALFHRLSVA